MMEKGFSQIDLVVGLSLMLTIMTFAIIYTNTIISPQASESRASILRSEAQSMGRTVFGDRGIPPDWPNSSEVVRPSLMEFIYRRPLHVLETNGSDHEDVVLSRNLTTDGRAWNGSIKVYHDNQSLPTDLEEQGDSDSDGFPAWVNVSFQLDLNANEKKILHVYYSGDDTISTSYSSLSQTPNMTINVTPLEEERLEGLTPKKLKRIHNRSMDWLKPKFGTRRSLRIEVENVTGSTYATGGTVPERTGIGIFEKRIIAQNGTAHINRVRATLWLW